MATITTDGSWTFPDTVTGGSSYDVSVAVQPDGQHCEIANGSGTVSDEVTNIEITCSSGTLYFALQENFFLFLGF